ncbi:NAD-dependent protein deacetylase sirtuin-3-like [Tubulanus polymorphus]|uniref:NAD-dependent protein deacetylase sirtuin-3-like n=1 Tax=Tubulanus polymorphus TaxID=672921 RepID=UPI003DA39879
MAGAGISTPSGIPDFRSPGTGLYDNLKQYSIPYPEAIFDIDYFHYKPRPFFELAKELYPSGKYRPNIIHYFVRMLYDRGLLLRMYTQNIDGLERLCGIPPAKMVEAHGTFATATCTACNKQYPGDEIKGDIFQGKIPYCRKRTSCSGVIKPDIVFFGEDLPKRFYYYLRDFPQADLLLVLGTSLEVEPFAGIVDSTRYHVPRVLLNMKAVGPFRRRKRFNDLVHEGDLVNSINELIRLLSWRQTLNTLTEQTNSQLDTMYAAQKHQISASSDNNTTDTSSTDGKPTSAQNNNNKPGLSNKPGLTNSKPGVAPPRPARQYHTYSASSRQRSGPARQSKSSFALPSIGGRESSNKIYTYRNMWNHRQQSSDSSSSDDDEESDEDDSSDSDD